MARKYLILDFWYGDTMSDCDEMSCRFSDIDCMWYGNFYKNGKCVGDYTADYFQTIDKAWRRAHECEEE